MKKRLISTIMAMTAIASMTGITANAKTAQEVIKEQQQKGQFLNCDEIEACSWYGWHSPYDVFYLSQNEDSSSRIYKIYRDPDRINFTVSKEIDEADKIKLEAQITKQINEIDSSLRLYGGHGGYDKNGKLDYVYQIDSIKETGGQNQIIETKTVKKIYELLKDDVLSFNFICDEYGEENIRYTYLTAYHFNEDIYITPVLEKFISENGINAQIVTYKRGDKDINGNEVWYDYMIYVIPDDEISAAEHLELAEKIYESTGLAPCGISLDVVHIITGTTIDVYNAIDGDTNNDGELTVADAAAILQYLGNAEAYPISDQGKFNADIEDDGITAADALTVQKMVLQSGNE